MRFRQIMFIGAFSLVFVAPAWGQGTLFVEGNKVGVGISSPAAPIHLSHDGTQALQFILENQGPPGMRFSNASNGATWFFRQNAFATFTISREGTGGDELRLKSNGELIIGPGGASNMTLDTAGNLTIAGNLSQGSSREIKEGFTPVDQQEVLSRVLELPISSWSYRADGSGVRHVGPMAEDFHGAFGFGLDEKHLAPADVAGIALAAIQGLQDEVERRDQRIDHLEQEIAALKSLVSNLAVQQEDAR